MITYILDIYHFKDYITNFTKIEHFLCDIFSSKYCLSLFIILGQYPQIGFWVLLNVVFCFTSFYIIVCNLEIERLQFLILFPLFIPIILEHLMWEYSLAIMRQILMYLFLFWLDCTVVPQGLNWGKICYILSYFYVCDYPVGVGCNQDCFRLLMEIL